MKRNLIGTLSLVVMSVLFNVNGGYAQSAAQANVPFAFNVGSSQLPAGRYRITAEDASVGVITIGNSATGARVLSIGQREYAGGRSWKLVFQHIGDRYFLTHIWGAPGSAGMKIQAPKPNTKLEIASKLSPSGKEVEIALK
jgi:hypothetical protein